MSFSNMQLTKNMSLQLLRKNKNNKIMTFLNMQLAKIMSSQLFYDIIIPQ